MNGSPYILPQLAATRAGIPDPLVAVDAWLTQLQDLLEAGVETADEAYDLLAAWAKMRRVRPELTAQPGAAGALARGDTLLAARGAHLATEALTIPNPQAWLEETQALVDAYEEAGEAAARSELAERLLADLDDAELVVYVSRRCGVDDRELETDLERCQLWLAEHVELFLAASVYIQAVGMAGSGGGHAGPLDHSAAAGSGPAGVCGVRRAGSATGRRVGGTSGHAARGRDHD